MFQEALKAPLELCHRYFRWKREFRNSQLGGRTVRKLVAGFALPAAGSRPAVLSCVRVLAWADYLRRLRYHSFLSERNGSADRDRIRGMGTRILATDAPDYSDNRGPGKRRFGN